MILYLELDRTQKRSYSKQIYRQIRAKILAGDLRAHDVLPSSRDLSKSLNVARNTVLNAYDMLISEGIAFSLPSSGVYVASGIESSPLSRQIQDIETTSLSDLSISKAIINFDSGIPALSLFPKSKWNKIVSKAFNEAPISALGYDDPQGRLELREVLSVYLKRTRGIACHPDQIVITAGTKQGLSLVAKCLLDTDSEVWIEDPTNENVRRIFSYHTNKVVPFEVDKEGIQPDLFPTEKNPALIFVTPSHQFPMGGILSIQRRFELVEYARKVNCYLLEDDYDSEFHYKGFPVHSLFELDTEHIIYTGTFSKVLFPSMRLGYLVVPFSLVPKIRELKYLADHHSNSLYQLALMRFIENGELERHIRHMKREYKNRRNNLLLLLHIYFEEKVKVYGDCSGMHIVGEFENTDFTAELVQHLLEKGVYIVPVEKHSIIKGKHRNQIILGFAQLSYDEMEKGIKILKEELNL